MKFLSKLFKRKSDEEDILEQIQKDKGGLENPFASTKPDFTDANYIGEVEILVNDEQYDVRKIAASPVVIGRDPSKANIIISEPIISKNHCTIYKEKNEIRIRDNNSTNGVYINNEKVSVKALNHNDVVWLGKKGTVKVIYRRTKGEQG